MKYNIWIVMILILFRTAESVAADSLPRGLEEKCRQKVLAADPVKITYNFGELKLDNTKTTAEVSKSCGGHDAVGCFHSSRVKKWRHQPRQIHIGDYVCHYNEIQVAYDFTGRSIDLSKEYDACGQRAILRHELQHFMIWKTSMNLMMKETKLLLVDQVAKDIKICSEEETYYADPHKLYRIFEKIKQKWWNIVQENDQILDEVDHDFENEVNDPVCFPASLTVSF
ncbi:MAG: hypothetical protein IJ852_04130 [Alphaproteobacteria bacterium]|nr:hypothetical protein [Alphaproteobacteria bacterium]